MDKNIIRKEIFKLLNEQADPFRRFNEPNIYQVPTVSGSNITVNKVPNTKSVHFKINESIVNGGIFVNYGNSLNLPLYDNDGNVVSTLNVGYYEMFYSEDEECMILLNSESKSKSELLTYDILGETITEIYDAINNIEVGEFTGVADGTISETKLSNQLRNDLAKSKIKYTNIININEYLHLVSNRNQNRNSWDWTNAFKQCAIDASNLSATVELNAEKYNITDSFIPNGMHKGTIHWKGKLSQINFINNIPGKALLNLHPGTSYSTFEGIIFSDQNKLTSIGIKISAYPQVGAFPNWKNRFTGCELYDFKVGVSFTSDGDVLINNQQDWSSENMFIHCKIRNCEIGVLNQNLQALNNSFVQTDIENDTSDEQFTLIRDEAGGGMYFSHCSLIGRGRVYEWFNPNDSSNLFISGHLFLDNCRFECRMGHIGQLFYQVPSTSLISKHNRLSIKVTNCQFIAYNQTIDLIHYSGKVNANFTNLDISSADFVIKPHSVLGISGNLSAGSFSDVIVEKCNNIRVEFGTSNKYGEITTRITPKIIVKENSVSPQGTFQYDNLGYMYLHDYEVNNLGYGLSSFDCKKIIFNETMVQSGFKDIAFKLPNSARPLKFGFFKEPIRFYQNSTFTAYIVKDTEFWSNPSEFNLETDAILCATLEDTSNKAGLFEENIQITTNELGQTLSVGNSIWKEGRMLFKFGEEGWNNTGGMIYVEYI